VKAPAGYSHAREADLKHGSVRGITAEIRSRHVVKEMIVDHGKFRAADVRASGIRIHVKRVIGRRPSACDTICRIVAVDNIRRR
jgi:hypothetical protein